MTNPASFKEKRIKVNSNDNLYLYLRKNYGVKMQLDAILDKILKNQN